MTDISSLDPQRTLESLTPDLYQRFLSAIEIGKWPNGAILTEQQRETCLQAIIIYENQHLPPEQRTGYVPPKKTPCDDGHQENPEQESPLSWKE